MTPKPKLPKLLKCPVCGKQPKVRPPTVAGDWARVACFQDDDSGGYHEVAALAKVSLHVAARRWNRMVGK